MRKFLFKVFIFLAGLVVMDILVGLGAKYLVNHAKGGTTRLCTYICHSMKEECLVFGSSRGQCHYDPDIIADSLGMSCWNCSKGGNGIILMYGRYVQIANRYTPRLIVYDSFSIYDLLANDNSKYLGNLRYFYDVPGIDSIFWSVDKNERYKMLSHLYQYNSSLQQLVADNIHPFLTHIKGYIPEDKKMTYKPKVSVLKYEDAEYDPLKLAYLEKLAVACRQKGTRLVFTISPCFGQTDDSVYKPLKDLCRKYGIVLLNHYCDSEFVYDENLFKDSVHMNRAGATKYTKKLTSELKEVMKRP